MSTFPSLISTISDPAATNKLNSPSHSSVETAQNDAVKKLETFIGTLSSAAGTLIYDIRAAASDGGGHVQVANKGGTGQTSYAKGDILVASSASVLSKLVVGSNDQALLADSAQSAGVKWGGVAVAADIQKQTYTYARASVHSASLYGVVLNQAVSVLSDGLGLVVKFPTANAGAMALTVNATGPSSLTALIKNTALGDLAANEIKASMIGVLEFDSVSSVFQMQPNKGYTDNQTSSVYTGVATKVSLSGNETVAGVKTFSSDPLIPDEAYGVGWNAVLEPPTKNAVYDKIETIIPVFGSGQTSRTVATGVGTQNVAHGLGRAPSLIKITAFYFKDGTSVVATSTGSSTGLTGETATNNYDIGNVGSTARVSQSSGNIIFIESPTPTTLVAADISATDETNFTLNFSVFGGGADYTVYIQWEAWV